MPTDNPFNVLFSSNGTPCYICYRMLSSTWQACVAWKDRAPWRNRKYTGNIDDVCIVCQRCYTEHIEKKRVCVEKFCNGTPCYHPALPFGEYCDQHDPVRKEKRRKTRYETMKKIAGFAGASSLRRCAHKSLKKVFNKMPYTEIMCRECGQLIAMSNDGMSHIAEAVAP